MKIKIVAICVVVAMILGACAVAIPKPPVVPPEIIAVEIPKPPVVPPEIISVWKSPPSPQGFPPDLLGSVALQPYGKSDNRQESKEFHLYEGQWIDVVATSDSLIYFGIEKPGVTCFKLECRLSEVGTASCDWESVIRQQSVFAPLFGKPLYENWITDTDKGRVFNTAVRLFAWKGAQTYYFSFINFDPYKETEVSYKLYKLTTTPGWGSMYAKSNLEPWLYELYWLLVSEKISELEYDKAERQWLEQFK